jgi:hypothetical protein
MSLPPFGRQIGIPARASHPSRHRDAHVTRPRTPSAGGFSTQIRKARGRRHEPRAARPCPPPPAAPRVRARRALPCAQPIRFFLAADSDTCVVFAAWLRSSRSGADARGLLASRIHPLRRLNCSAAEAAPGPTEEAPASTARKYVPRLPSRVVFDVML